MKKTAKTLLGIISIGVLFALIAFVILHLSFPFGYFLLIKLRPWSLAFVLPAISCVLFYNWRQFKHDCIQFSQRENPIAYARKLKWRIYSDLLVMTMFISGMLLCISLIDSSFLHGLMCYLCIAPLAILGRIFIYKKYFKVS